MRAKDAELKKVNGETMANRKWLAEQMPPYFFVAMMDEPEAMALLERELGTLRHNRRLVLARSLPGKR